MSIHAITMVLDFAPEHWIPATRMVALALADRVNQDGICWPSVADLQRRSGLSKRWVQYQLRIIEQDGWIERVGQGSNRCGQPVSNVWRWTMWSTGGVQRGAPGGVQPSAPPV